MDTTTTCPVKALIRGIEECKTKGEVETIEKFALRTKDQYKESERIEIVEAIHRRRHELAKEQIEPGYEFEKNFL